MGTPFQILCEQNYFSKGQLVITDKSYEWPRPYQENGPDAAMAGHNKN